MRGGMFVLLAMCDRRSAELHLGSDDPMATMSPSWCYPRDNSSVALSPAARERWVTASVRSPS